MNRQQSASPYFLHQGTNYRAYDYLGVHYTSYEGYTFRVWAPNASDVFLVGDFCGWEHGLGMRRVSDGGVFEITLSERNVSVGDKYKFKVVTRNGEHIYRADPYATATERQPADASVIGGADRYAWRDATYLAYRRSGEACRSMNIYELDISLWKRNADGSYLGYAQAATELAPYVKQMGYTHICLDGVFEYIEDAEGRELYSYYAPSSRFGSPRDFAAFVDSMHEAGIGVLLKISAPAFPVRALARFDGEPLYECERTPKFDVTKREVECYLISAACFWLDRYHIDGLNLDGLSEFLGPREGVKKYLAATAFFRKLNSYIKESFEGVVMIADDVSARSGKTAISDGGLGFDAIRRPLSEKEGTPTADEVLTLCAHGGQGYAYRRAELAYLMSSKGHKLTRMGEETGQRAPLDWNFGAESGAAGLQLCAAELGQLLLRSRVLREGSVEHIECGAEGVACYARVFGKERVTVLVNLTDKTFENFSLEVPRAGTYKEIFNSDALPLGGEGRENVAETESREVAVGVYKNSIQISIPPMATILLVNVSDGHEKRKSK